MTLKGSNIAIRYGNEVWRCTAEQMSAPSYCQFECVPFFISFTIHLPQKQLRRIYISTDRFLGECKRGLLPGAILPCILCKGICECRTWHPCLTRQPLRTNISLGAMRPSRDCLMHVWCRLRVCNRHVITWDLFLLQVWNLIFFTNQDAWNETKRFRRRAALERARSGSAAAYIAWPPLRAPRVGRDGGTWLARNMLLHEPLRERGRAEQYLHISAPLLLYEYLLLQIYSRSGSLFLFAYRK